MGSSSAVTPRWLDGATLGAVIVAYVVALWDASPWVWAPLLLPVAAHVLRVAVSWFPAWLTLVVTVVVVVSLNVDLHAEGSFFLVCMGAFVTAADRDRWFPERLVLALSVLSPIVDAAAGSEAVRDWNWPFWSMGIAISWAFGAVLLHQRRLTASLRAAQELLADQAAGEERRRIAREVHDLVGHSLTVVLLHLTGARRLVRRDPDEAEAALAAAEQAGRDSLAEIRRTVGLLRDERDALTPTPGFGDLAALIDASRSAGLVIDAELAPSLEELDNTTGLAVYRIVQESLANVARHAAGAPATVRVGLCGDNVEIEIVNSGGGISTAEPGIGRSGLPGMRERAVALDGSLHAGPHGRGWRVHATLPRARSRSGTAS